MAGLLRSISKLVAPLPLEPVTLEIAGRTVVVTFKINARARRLILRMNKQGTGAVLTVPPRLSKPRALAFIDQSRLWLEQQLGKVAPRLHVAHGAELLFHGELHTIIAPGGRRGTVTLDEASRSITVPGDEAHVERRLKDWLKKQALAEVTTASRHYAKAMNTSIGRITIRDQSTRWGSCSASGDLSYSWRLVMAPKWILEYVVAHEVAHRLHMNHGPRFWRLVMQHNPDVRAAKVWFKANGRELHRYL